MISRHHATFLQTEEKDEFGRNKWKVADQKSLNGVFVNDVKVSEAILEYVE
jgi:pSer/pThr/pTyr-binding forkhead associated (FHA) protein